MTKVALVLTVKNEERILRQNLLYHKEIGASHIFVYFDNSTDGGKESIQDLDFVTFRNSVAMEDYKDLDFLNKFTSQGHEHHTARQCLNTYDAQLQCKAQGIDWLISLDADELVCTSFDTPSNLPQFFSEINETINLVNLQTREVLQQKESYGNIFKEEQWCKTTHKYKSRWEKIKKSLYNPFTKQKQKFNYWYGQHLGKGAIRIGKGIIPHNVHRYKMQDGNKVSQENTGFVLHYHAYDATDFIKKFTNFSDHPDTFLSGNKVENIKLLLRDVVNKTDYSEAELTSYFVDNLMFHPEEVSRLLKNTYFLFFKRKVAPLQKISSISQVFERINNH